MRPQNLQFNAMTGTFVDPEGNHWEMPEDTPGREMVLVGGPNYNADPGKIVSDALNGIGPGHVVDFSQTTAIEAEYKRARGKFPAFNSPHEGFAVLKKEVDEMWDAVKANNIAAARAEAIQVAAMALAFLLEVFPKDPGRWETQEPKEWR